MLPDFTHQHFPEVNEIVLEVNKQNIAAQKLYEKTEFQHIGSGQQEGIGLLSIMSMEIRG